MGRFDGVLFCTDLDGTVLTSEKTVSKENHDAIEYFKSEGGYFTFITGRMPCTSAKICEMLNPNAPTKYLSKFGKRYNFPGLHPHTLRHTMATVSIANGADVVSVSKKLGHAAPSITLNIYSHANQEAQLRANKSLEMALYKNA